MMEMKKGVSVIYENNGKVNVGEYKVTAKFIGDGLNYHPIPHMTATLTITQAEYDMSNIKFEDKTVTYDGNEHKKASVSYMKIMAKLMLVNIK